MQVELSRQRLRMFPPDFGDSTYMVSVPLDRVRTAVESLDRLLAHLSYRGVFEAEFKYDAREHCYKLLDINGRVWAWTALGRRAGIDFPYLMWLQSQGEPVPECTLVSGSRAGVPAGLQATRVTAASRAIRAERSITPGGLLQRAGADRC